MASLQRRIESSREQLVDVSSVLTQRLAQQESLQRLIVAAEERLNQEKEAKEQTQQELEYATSEEEKQHTKDVLENDPGTKNARPITDDNLGHEFWYH